MPHPKETRFVASVARDCDVGATQSCIRKRSLRIHQSDLKHMHFEEISSFVKFIYFNQESGISTENLANIASSFRRLTAPNIGTTTEREIEESLQGDSKEALKDESKLPPLTPNSQSLVASNQDEEEPTSKQATDKFSESQKSSTTSKKNNKAGLRKKTSRKRKDTLHSIPEAEALNEKDIILQGDGTVNRKSAKDLVKSPSTRSLPTDLSKFAPTHTVVNRRGSLPSAARKADCVSSQSQLMRQRIVPKHHVRPISTENSSAALSKHGVRAVKRDGYESSLIEQLGHQTNRQKDDNYESIQDHAIKSVAQSNASPSGLDLAHCQLSSDHEYFKQSGENEFAHTAFYSSTPGMGLQHHHDALSQSADSRQVLEHDDVANDIDSLKDSFGNLRTVTRSSIKSSADQSDLQDRNCRMKPCKTSLIKQVRSEKISRAKMRSDFLDKEPFTRYSRRAHGQVTPMYGQPRRMEFNPPTRKLQHEQEKMLRDEQNTELQSQIKIDNFFKDLFEIKDAKSTSKGTKKSDEEKPKKQTLTLAGVLSQLYNAKDTDANNKNSLEWLQKCQYLRVYNPMDKKLKDRAQDSKISSWDEAEKKLKAGFLEMFYQN